MAKVNWWSMFMVCFVAASLVCVWTEQSTGAVANAVLAVAMAIMSHHDV